MNPVHTTIDCVYTSIVGVWEGLGPYGKWLHQHT